MWWPLRRWGSCRRSELVLDLFHSSGTTVAVAATSGLPRLKELLSVSHNMKTPSITLFLGPSEGARVVVALGDEQDEATNAAIQNAKDAGLGHTQPRVHDARHTRGFVIGVLRPATGGGDVPYAPRARRWAHGDLSGV